MSFEVGEEAEASALVLADPAIGNLVNGYGVEVSSDQAGLDFKLQNAMLPLIALVVAMVCRRLGLPYSAGLWRRERASRHYRTRGGSANRFRSCAP